MGSRYNLDGEMDKISNLKKLPNYHSKSEMSLSLGEYFNLIVSPESHKLVVLVIGMHHLHQHKLRASNLPARNNLRDC